MVYREPAEELVRRAALAAEATGPLAKLDASGRKGADGADGSRGHDGHSAGADGGVGGDATNARRGEAGGTILLVLERAEGSAAVHVARARSQITSWRGEETVRAAPKAGRIRGRTPKPTATGRATRRCDR